MPLKDTPGSRDLPTRHSPGQPVLSDDDERLYRREQET